MARIGAIVANYIALALADLKSRLPFLPRKADTRVGDVVALRTRDLFDFRTSPGFV